MEQRFKAHLIIFSVHIGNGQRQQKLHHAEGNAVFNAGEDVIGLRNAQQVAGLALGQLLVAPAHNSAQVFLFECPAQAKAIIDGMLYDHFQGDEDAYYTTTMEEQANLINAMMGVVMGVLVAIAAISLLVGGIGIMNIMLVSVTERTREIGIRKSLGAKRRDIRSQFVIEAGTTSAIGGLLGIALGCLLAMGVGSLIGAMLTSQMGGGATFSATPTLGAVAISFGVSVGIGVLFGYLPANKAAKLNPIDALRYD